MHLPGRFFVNFTRAIVGIIALMLLVACSGLNFGTANALQSVDVFGDDIGEMSFAIDIPLSLLPEDDGMIFKMGTTTAELGERHIEATLVRGDDILAFPGLAAPANNRTYHLFAFSDADKEKIVEFQAWIKNIRDNNDNIGGELSMRMGAKFCRVANADVSNARITVYISLPGRSDLRPLLSNVTLQELGGLEAENLPVCVQT